MNHFAVFRSPRVVGPVLVAFLMLVLPVPGTAQKTGSLTGTIYWDDVLSKNFVENAVVKLRNIQTNTEYASNPTDKKGNYLMTGLPEGRYLVGVGTPRGDFNLNIEVAVMPGETGLLSAALKIGDREAAVPPRARKGFFAQPAGIALVIAGAGLVSFGGYELLKKEDKSPKKK
jgi:hypothetical protein